MLEVNTAILCASVPALKPIFTPERIREFRRQKKAPAYRGPNDDPFDIHGNGSGPYSRKPSNASLYPDLEVYDLDKVSARSHSPTGLSHFDDNLRFPTQKSSNKPRMGREEQEEEEYFQVPFQRAFQPV